jgi:hypothetical protein
MTRTAMLAGIILLAGCASPTGPQPTPSEEARESYYADDATGLVITFFVAAPADVVFTFRRTVGRVDLYWWGNVTVTPYDLTFRLWAPAPEDAPVLGDAAWLTWPHSFEVTVDGARLTFTRG